MGTQFLLRLCCVHALYEWSFTPPQSYEVGTIINSIVQMKHKGPRDLEKMSHSFYVMRLEFSPWPRHLQIWGCYFLLRQSLWSSQARCSFCYCCLVINFFFLKKNSSMYILYGEHAPIPHSLSFSISLSSLCLYRVLLIVSCHSSKHHYSWLCKT